MRYALEAPEAEKRAVAEIRWQACSGEPFGVCRVTVGTSRRERTMPLVDERFTTVDANRRLSGAGLSRKKKQGRLDAIAALVLLESFLEACRYRGEIAGEPVGSAPSGGESLQ